MRIKSYFSGTVESAMDLARRELGDEAVILNSRAAPGEARHLGAYEVVFGVDDTAPALPLGSLGLLPPSGNRPPPGPAPGERGHRFEVLEGEIVALRHELRKMSRGILAPVTQWKSDALTHHETTLAQTRREDQRLVAFLVRRDLPEGAAGELVRRGRERLRKGSCGLDWRTIERRSEGQVGSEARGRDRSDVQKQDVKPGPGLFSDGSGVFPAQPGLLADHFADESPLASAVLDQMAAVLRVDATLGRNRAATPNLSCLDHAGELGPKVVALVGGAGAGKTTMLVKLAAHYGLRSRRPAHIISTDNLRVGAAEQLRSLAAILGVGFDLAETAVALGQLLNEHANKDLILIDTPGLSPGQMEDGAAVARFLGNDPRVDCHLVVPAYQKGPDVARLLDRFHPYCVSKVILTRLDETEAIGGLLLALDEHEARISFLSMGQTIPEDLEAASVARLLDLFVGDPPMGAFFAARDNPDFEDGGLFHPGAGRESMATAASRG